MEEQDLEGPQPILLTTVLPLPPPFYKTFTKENLHKLRNLRNDTTHGQNEESNIATALLSLPPELRTLIPPPPPPNGRCRIYGTELGVPPKTLTDYGAEQLVPTDFPLDSSSAGPSSQQRPQPSSDWTRDRAYYLLKLTRSMMLNFLELAGTLSVNPADAWEKMRDIQMLFYNAHQLINEYRPHQARYALAGEMEARLLRLREEIDGVKELKGRVGELLAELGAEGREEAETKRNLTSQNTAKEQTRRERQQSVWAALDSELAV